MILCNIIFNDNTDYDKVLETTKRYFSVNVLNYTKKLNNKITISYLYNTLSCIYTADYLKKSGASNIRYNKAVKKAFLSLNYNK